MTSRIAAGLIEEGKVVGDLLYFPAESTSPSHHEGGFDQELIETPSDAIAAAICDMICRLVPDTASVGSVGIALPGIVREGVVEDSPNLQQMKGARIRSMIEELLAARGCKATVTVMNDADAEAAGLAATRGQLDKLTRVWTIGNGIGFGRFPYTGGPWEGGHTVVSLDPKENYCACGGKGHLEGITGHRAMRLRFLDMEPDEIFAAARKGDKRCRDFVELWHRALAAATATQIHLEGPGRFYFTGRDIQRLDLPLLKEYLWESVKMSPFQSYTVEVYPPDPTISVIGAGTVALHTTL